jgi:hypothetical protein
MKKLELNQMENLEGHGQGRTCLILGGAWIAGTGFSLFAGGGPLTLTGWGSAGAAWVAGIAAGAASGCFD